jgi:photosystem II stability/assembly factor-like uncharacterized protein
MKCRSRFNWLAAALCGFSFCISTARAQDSSFTYQGFLRDSNSAPASGDFQMQFKLRPAASSTNQVGPTLTNGPVTVSNGLFTTTLNFGGAVIFDGSPRWLEVAVRTNGSTNAFFVLSPTQPFTSTPYAIRAAVATAFIGPIFDTQLSSNIARFDTAGHFTAPMIFDNASGQFSGGITATGSVSGTLGGTFSGNASGTFSGNSSGNFSGNGANITNINVTNIAGVIQSNPNWQLIQTNIQQAVSSNNYITTNDSLTTLILPSGPGLGSTLRISGSGAAGWLLAQNAGQSIFTGNLGLPAGRAWTAHAAGGATNIAWKDIASSADGLKLVAVVGSGFIFTSTDGGFSWTQRATNRAYVAVTSSADGTHLAAAVGSGFIYTSADSGSNWIQRGAVHAWTDIASSADGTKLVATAGSENIYTSVDTGTNWTARASVLAWSSVASSADGVKLAAVVNGGAIFTSADSGVTWSNRGGVLAFSGITSSSDGNKLAACVNGSFLFTSGDAGVSWTPRGISAAWSTISSSGDGVNLVAAIGGAGTIYSSFDSGQTWIQRTTNNLAWQATAFSTDGTRVAAAVNVGQIFTSASVTSVGTNGSLAGSQYSSVELQYVGNGLWIPLNATGKFTGN